MKLSPEDTVKPRYIVEWGAYVIIFDLILEYMVRCAFKGEVA